MIIFLLLHMYQIRNFWFEYGAIKISIVPSIILTLPSLTIKIIKDMILNNQISKNSRNWKKCESDAFIKMNVALIKIIAIDETMQNIHHLYNIWKKQFIVLASRFLKNHEKIAKFCLIEISKSVAHR